MYNSYKTVKWILERWPTRWKHLISQRPHHHSVIVLEKLDVNSTDNIILWQPTLLYYRQHRALHMNFWDIWKLWIVNDILVDFKYIEKWET